MCTLLQIQRKKVLKLNDVITVACRGHIVTPFFFKLVIASSNRTVASCKWPSLVSTRESQVQTRESRVQTRDPEFKGAMASFNFELGFSSLNSQLSSLNWRLSS